MGIALFFFGSSNTFLAVHYISSKYLGSPRCLCQHSQDAQVGSICRMQLRPSDIVVSPDILRLF